MDAFVTDVEHFPVQQPKSPRKTVLFLCSGNYYRSRFAEYYFNWLADQQGLAWRAVSRGFRLNTRNVGPIAPIVAETFAAWQIPIVPDGRNPRPADAADLAAADLVIAVKETEHRPMAEQYHPAWVDRILYWQIDDVDCAAPEIALKLLADNVRTLVASLAGGE